MPDGIAPDENWVDVNLTQQVSVALTGNRIRRVILSTTGQPGFKTPTGQFNILYRVANEAFRVHGASQVGVQVGSLGHSVKEGIEGKGPLLPGVLEVTVLASVLFPMSGLSTVTVNRMTADWPWSRSPS